MQELIILRERITALIKSYKVLQKSHAALEKACAGKDATIAALSEQLTHADLQLLASQAGSIIDDGTEKIRVRKQLDHVIGEIDNILTTLND